MERWIVKWKKNGWRSSTGEEVKNRDLFERLDKVAMDIGENRVRFVRVLVAHLPLLSR